MSDRAVTNGWKDGVLTDISEVNPSVSLYNLDLNAPVTFLSMADVGENGRVLTPQTRLMQEVRNGFTRFVEGDVLFAKITPCMENGKGAFAINLANGHGFGSTEFHVLRANEFGDSEFIFHVTQNSVLRSKAESYFSGSAGQQRVSTDFFSKYSMLIPSIPEQKKIARILTTVDNLIEKTEALIEKYKAIKQGMMHDLFTRGVDQNGKLRPPYEEAPHLYKESPLGWIPKEWDAIELSAACTWSSGGTPSKSNTSFWQGELPWASPKDMKTFELSDTIDHVSEEGAQAGSRLLEKGTVLIVIRGMILAHTFPVAIVCRRMAFNQDMKALVCNPDIQHRFLAHWLVSNSDQLLRLATESTHGTKRYDLSDLYNLAFPRPNSDEQSAIVERIDSLDGATNSEIERLESLRVMKTGLMQDLLTGKVRVNVDETEEGLADG